MKSLERTYNVLCNDKKVEMTYEDICQKLGFIPECNFVKITSRGTISFYVGKPDEVRALLAACRRCGFTPAKSILEFEKNRKTS